MDPDKLDAWWSSLTDVQQAEAATLTDTSAVPDWLVPSCSAAGLPMVQGGLMGSTESAPASVVPRYLLDYLKGKSDTA